MKLAILGAGAWGISLAVLFHRQNKFNIAVWEYDSKAAAYIKLHRKLKDKLIGLKIPEAIYISSNISEVIDNATCIINAVPTQFIRSYFPLIQEYDFTNKIFINVSKGFEVESGQDIRTLFLENIPTITDNNFVVLAGPSFAHEIAVVPTPTVVVAASKNIKTASYVRDNFSSSILRIYSNDDVIGVEIGGAVKNIFAIAAGIIDGLGMGNNTKAAMLTRGLSEIVRFGLKMGARRETFSGLSGIGDIILTCNSSLSRNYQVGYRLGRGETLPNILNSMNMVAEGVDTTRSIYNICTKMNIEMPITESIFGVLYNNNPPKEEIMQLMQREPKIED